MVTRDFGASLRCHVRTVKANRWRRQCLEQYYPDMFYAMGTAPAPAMFGEAAPDASSVSGARAASSLASEECSCGRSQEPMQTASVSGR
jgi:hypothetical protein